MRNYSNIEKKTKLKKIISKKLNFTKNNYYCRMAMYSVKKVKKKFVSDGKCYTIISACLKNMYMHRKKSIDTMFCSLYI